MVLTKSWNRDNELIQRTSTVFLYTPIRLRGKASCANSPSGMLSYPLVKVVNVILSSGLRTLFFGVGSNKLWYLANTLLGIKTHKVAWKQSRVFGTWDIFCFQQSTVHCLFLQKLNVCTPKLQYLTTFGCGKMWSRNQICRNSCSCYSAQPSHSCLVWC